jgi:cytidine deaminase
MLSKKYSELIEYAKSLVKRKKVRGGTVNSVACVLISEKENIYKGSSLNLCCGIGFCAEHAAIASMITETNETYIKAIVAANKKVILPPCGRCRELMSLIDIRNLETDIIISENKKTKLKKLLPIIRKSL